MKKRIGVLLSLGFLTTLGWSGFTYSATDDVDTSDAESLSEELTADALDLETEDSESTEETESLDSGTLQSETLNADAVDSEITASDILTPEPRVSNPPLAAAGTTAPITLLYQREQYKVALKQLEKREYKEFKKTLDTIKDYPLAPYLSYRELKRRLSLLPYQDIDTFLDANPDTYLGDQMGKRWLLTLAKKERWHDYQTYYQSLQDGGSKMVGNDAELDCYFLDARVNTGDESALKEVEPLWNVGHSQPDACDSLFKDWMVAGYLTPEIAWDRYSKAIQTNKRSLAQYVARHMPADEQKLAALYLDVDRHPEHIKQQAQFKDQSPQMQEIVLHGVRRYARRDAKSALKIWETYDAKNYFADEDRRVTQEYLISRLAIQGHMDLAQQLLEQYQYAPNEDLVAWMVRDALRNMDWQQVYNTLQLFSQEEQQNERWLYWRARAVQQLKIEDPDYPTPDQIYSSLALTRTFYGFMASDILGREYTLVDRPVNSPAEQVEWVASQPAIKRSGELWVLGQLFDARHEWQYGTRDLKPEEVMAAGKLAERWGWHRKSIQSMISVKHWDDLQLRFPLAYPDEMELASKETQIEKTLLYAIARQESALTPDARSSAGAMGLMQLMPATAKQTARNTGVNYEYWDLIIPSANIQLGSRYLNELLGEFNGDRVLATAAYNAGPYRVKQWIKNNNQAVPYDVWIETIPFSETRGYVQNVLSFSVIYAYRLGQQSTLLVDKKTDQLIFSSSN